MTLRPDPMPIPSTLLLALLGGAVIGAIAMALTTPKTGREVRATLRGVLQRGGAEDLDLESLDDDRLEALFI